jgi:MFS family permease
VSSAYVADVLPALVILGLGFGMIFAPAINTATTGVRQRDSGVASALVNTMQQVGGSIGTSALSTAALTATASYLVTHHTGPLAPAVAATHGYTLAFTISAALLGFGFLLAIVVLPSKREIDERRRAEAAPTAAAAPGPAQPAAPQPAGVQPAAARLAAANRDAVRALAFEAIPVALCSCSPVVTRPRESMPGPRR